MSILWARYVSIPNFLIIQPLKIGQQNLSPTFFLRFPVHHNTCRPAFLSPSSLNIDQDTKKNSASPAKVFIEATLDPEPLPPPQPILEKSPSPSSSSEEELKGPSKQSLETEPFTSDSASSDDDASLTTASTNFSTAESTEPDNEDYDDVEDYDYSDDHNDGDLIDNEDTDEDRDDENNISSMSPTMGAAASEQMVLNSNLTDPKLRATLIALSKCKNFECIKKIHYEIDGRTRFNFPHFFLIGWQKCATTTVNAHLRRHPQFLPSDIKEPHWFTVCKNSPTNINCKASSLRNYLMQFLRMKDAAYMGLERATIDASVDYAWKGRALSTELHGLFPWLKIVMMMRDPISRMISYTRMFTVREVGGKGCMPPKTIYGCLHKGLSKESAVYANALEAWLETFPAEQVHVIQFEDLQENEQRVLHDLKVFLGMDAQLPVQEKLRNVNSRKNDGGYPLTLEEYQSLVALVRPGAERVAKLLGDKGIKNEEEWIGRWESVWDRVIEESCDDDGQCEVNSN